MLSDIYIYVDVDDTFVRSFGSKRIPIPRVIEQVKILHEQGAELYCWSSGGAAYAKASAQEFGLEHCFKAFLPKPNILLDDLGTDRWPFFTQIHPNSCGNLQLSDFLTSLTES